MCTQYDAREHLRYFLAGHFRITAAQRRLGTTDDEGFTNVPNPLL